jgi:hypothetical protein
MRGMQDVSTLAGLQVAGWRGGAALSDKKNCTAATDGACVAGGVQTYREGKLLR